MGIELIAEIGNSHGGDYNRALRLIDAATDAGADSVKFQCYLPEELVRLRGDGPAPAPWNDKSMLQLYVEAQTPHAWFPGLVRHCERVGIPWFSSVFGPRSLELLEGLECPRYKLASLDFARADWRDAVLATGKPLIYSCAAKRRPDIAGMALYCPPGYPQPEPDAIGVLNGGYDGYSYHGTNWRVPVDAVWYGAKVIEVHFHLREEPNPLEASCCLDQYQFAHMVGGVRSYELK